MAHTTKLTIDDFLHGDVIAARAHLKSQLKMTNLATKSNAMEPVRVNHRPHALLLRMLIEYHVGIFR